MNTLSAISLCGDICRYHGMIGEDKEGQNYRELARTQGIEMNLKAHPNRPTGQCISFITAQSRQRTMMFDGGAGLEFSFPHFGKEILRDGDHFIGEGYWIEKPELEQMLIWAKEMGQTTSLGLSSEWFARKFESKFTHLLTSQLVDVLIGNEQEMKAFTGNSDPVESCRTLGQRCKVVIVTLGDKGCVVKAGEAEPKIYNAVTPEKVVSTVGAGDAFLGAFLSGWKRNYAIEICVELGATAGALAVANVTAQITNDRLGASEKLRAIFMHLEVYAASTRLERVTEHVL